MNMSHSIIHRRNRGERGVALGIVLMLIVVLLLAGGLAVWGLSGETASATNDRLSRQLLDCAEEGLAWGKQYFSTTGSSWDTFLNASNICTQTDAPCSPNGPIRQQTITGSLTSVSGYPMSSPWTTTWTGAGSVGSLKYTVAIFDNADDTGTQNYFNDNDSQIFVYSRCMDTQSRQSRAVQALIKISAPSTSDYQGQAGHGFRNQGNANQGLPN